MKAVVACVLLAGPAAAFVTPAAPRVVGSALKMADDRSVALPFDKRPPNLDGSLPGDVGFDPAGFTNNPPRPWLIGGEGSSLKWYQEAEIVHSRIAMLAALGWVFPAFFHLPGNADVGLNAFAETNPFKALETVPKAAIWQILTAMSVVEHFRIARVFQGDAPAGDLGLGQTGWNPFNFDYTPEEYKEKQTQEIKNGRAAMVAIIAMFLQCQASGVGLVEQLGGGLGFPEAVSKAGYYFPSGL